MKKRILALALSLCMMLSMMPTAYAGEGFLTLDGQQPEVSQHQEQPQQQEGFLTLDGQLPESDEPSRQPEEGVLTLDQPDLEVQEPTTPIISEESEQNEGVLFVQCDFCGYLDGNHADDCATQQPEEEIIVVKPAAERKAAIVYSFTYQDTFDALMEADTLSVFESILDELTASQLEEFYDLLSSDELDALDEQEDELAQAAVIDFEKETSTKKTVTVERRASLFGAAQREMLRQLGYELIVDMFGWIVDAIDLPQNDYTVMEAVSPATSADYQWQILADDDLWVDIYNETDSLIRVSYAMVANLLDRYDAVQVRCEITGEDGVTYTDPVEVTVDYTSEDVIIDAEAEPVVEDLIVEEGVVEDVVIEEPIVEEPIVEEPIIEEPIVEEPIVEEPIVEEPIVEEPIVEEPIVEEPIIEEPIVEEPIVEEPIVEEPVVEEPVAQTFSVTRLGGTYAQPFTVSRLSTDGEAAPAAETPELKDYTIVVNYVFEDNEIVADPYTATLAAGSNFSATVTFPTVQGYLAYWEKETDNSTSRPLNVTNIQADVTYTVTYKPTNVNYTVIHYQQNIDNDNYTEFERKTLQGLTKSTVPEVAQTYPGFYALLYEKPEIAADGSTIVEIYYDRMYYLMNFDLDGGYGVEPIYARYGAPIDNTAVPEKPGYTFAGWTLDGENTVDIPATMPAESRSYTALWKDPNSVKYTVVYWKENADDTGYSFWGSEIKTATAGSKVSGSDSIPASISTTTVDGSQVNEKPYFTYNAARTDKDVVIAGDGSSVVNVYYYRNVYTIYFYGYGKCALEAHSHTDACYTLDCGLTAHSHDGDCEQTLTCPLTEHSAHSEACCVLDETHVHSINCYSNAVVDWGVQNPQNAPNNPSNGQIYVRNRYSYIYFGGNWYYYLNYYGTESGTIVQPDQCSGAHTHGDGNCTCNLTIHTHGENCYEYSCGLVNHTHTSTCYRLTCTKPVHTHGTNCNSNNNDNVIHVITAKYEQDISAVWPTYDVLKDGEYAYEDSDGNVEDAGGSRFRGWDIDGFGTTEVVSKRVTMTKDLCDTNDNAKNAEAQYGGSNTYRLYYMFESYDQSSAAVTPDTDGNARRQYRANNVTRWYDSDPDFYQELITNTNQNFSQKEITGMNPVGVTSETNDSIHYNYLYYTRNRVTLTYQNVDTVVKTVSNIMYGQPLVNYKDSAGNLLSAYELDDDDYPIEDLRGLYKFDGWYTTPECFEGTEFDFATATMPNNNLTLYAKWAPINHTVEFYLTQDKITNGEKLYADATVAHGSKIDPAPATPSNGSYKFVGWFYTDNGVEKAFDFANMAVNKDMQVYAKWSSDVLKEYTVYYKIQGTDTDIADPTKGSGLAGITKTFDAKGGEELYKDYQEGYFPVTKSHSLTLDIENDANNVFTFWYVQKDAVPYTVHYVTEEQNDAGTLEEIELDGKTYYIVAAKETNNENRKAVVTEKFKVVPGYMPDAYQKRLIVDGTDGAENKIIFIYSVDTTHAYYKITHYTQNTDGKNWTEYASSQIVGNIGETYSADSLTIDGFTYSAGISTASGKLTENGLELMLYYVRNEYPYQVRYLEQGTGKQLDDPKDGTGKYGQVISESAINIDNYTAVDPTSQTLNIRIEESQTEAKLNIITFYYEEKEVTINYEVVGPPGCGTVDPDSETVKVLSGTATGSTATAADETFKFVGWYDNEACTGTALSTDAKYVPTKEESAVWTNTTYYAKFEYNLTSLTIKKEAQKGTVIDSDQTFVFKIVGSDGFKTSVIIKGEGSVTITGLTVGVEYTVTEDTSWSWRYTPDKTSKEITLTANASTNEVSFANKLTNNKWFTFIEKITNIFDTPKQ